MMDLRTQAERDADYRGPKSELPWDGGLARLQDMRPVCIPFPMYGTPDGINYNADGMHVQAVEWIRQWNEMDTLLGKFHGGILDEQHIRDFKEAVNKEASRFLPFKTEFGLVTEFDVTQTGQYTVNIVPEYQKTPTTMKSESYYDGVGAMANAWFGTPGTEEAIRRTFGDDVAAPSIEELTLAAKRYAVVRQVTDWSTNMRNARTPEEFDLAVDSKE